MESFLVRIALQQIAKFEALVASIEASNQIDTVKSANLVSAKASLAGAKEDLRNAQEGDELERINSYLGGG